MITKNASAKILSDIDTSFSVHRYWQLELFSFLNLEFFFRRIQPKVLDITKIVNSGNFWT